MKKTDRQARVPLGVPRLKLQFPERPGYVRRVIADRPGRLEDALRGGWTFVTEDDNSDDLAVGLDSRVSRVIGRHPDGTPMRGYLMEIPKELYDADQAAKMKWLDEVEAAMREGRDQFGSPGVDGRYIPKPGIRIERE